MALKKLSLKTRLEHRGMRLDHALSLLLPEALGRPVSKGQVRKLVVAGAVYLNGKRVRIASKELMPNATIDAYVDLARLDTPAQKTVEFKLGPDRILFEDEHLIFVDKPPGLPTQPTLDEARSNLFKSVKRYLSQKSGEVDPYLALHHRLDRDTSGVIVLVKHKAANAGIAEAFTAHTARKTYEALAHRPRGSLPPSGWTVRNNLGKVSRSGKRAQFGAVKSGGDPAHTDFKLLAAGRDRLYVEAKPLTGRTHQIRVHLAEEGLPILGDELYGGDKAAAPRVMLHARRLEIRHPITGEELRIESPLPEDFRKALAELKP